MQKFLNLILGKKETKPYYPSIDPESDTKTVEIQLKKTISLEKRVRPPQIRKPNPEEIATRAYQIWESEGRPEGQDEASWARAEAELTLSGKMDFAH